MSSSHALGAKAWTVLFHDDGSIAEASGANLCAVVGDRLVRPPRHYALEGISLETVCELAQVQGLSIEERPITFYDLVNADETMLTSTSFCVLPIVSIDGIPLPGGGNVYSTTLDLWKDLVGFDFVKQAEDAARGVTRNARRDRASAPDMSDNNEGAEMRKERSSRIADQSEERTVANCCGPALRSLRRWRRRRGCDHRRAYDASTRTDHSTPRDDASTRADTTPRDDASPCGDAAVCHRRPGRYRESGRHGNLHPVRRPGLVPHPRAADALRGVAVTHRSRVDSTGQERS